MSELNREQIIKVLELRLEVEKHCARIAGVPEDIYTATTRDTLSLIKELTEAPAADVVEVVRCEKCKHLEVINDGEIYAKCRMTDFEFLPFGTDTRKHYCGYGERREK